MKSVLLQLLGSKKFWMTILAILSVVLGKFGLNISDDQLWTLVAPWLVLTGGYALQDHKKEAAKTLASLAPIPANDNEAAHHEPGPS